MAKPNTNTERDEKLKASYLGGKSLRQVALDSGIPESTVRRYLINTGVEMRQQGYSAGSHGAHRSNNGRGLLGWLYGCGES